MGTGIVTYGTDPRAKTITVYYTESSTIYEGMPVCYEFDATTNWLGVSSIDATTTASSVTESTTTSEGSQNEGKFIRVEDPDADNIHAFAGVVAGAGLAGKTGPCALDIYIPNGAIVPVRTDQSCTVGRTVLAVHTAEQHLTGPYHTAGRPVAVAWETVDRSSTTGVCLAKLDTNLFIHQKGDATTFLVDDQDTGATMTLNQIFSETACTTGVFCGLQVRAKTAGAYANANAGGGVCAYLRSEVAGTASAHTVGVHMQHLQSSGTTSGYHFGCWIKAAISSGVTATDTVIAPLALETLVSAADSANSQYMMYLKHNGAYTPDGLFMAYNSGSIGMETQSAAAVSHVIPIRMQTTESGGAASGTYYIMVSNAA